MSLLNFLKSRTFLKQIGFAILAFIILIFVLKWWLGFTTNHGQRIEVPDLSKKSIAEVKKQLESLDLGYVIKDSTSYDPEYPKKSVVEQDPEPGDFVKEDRKIYLNLNPSKFRNITIPDLNGKTRRQAESHLLSIGFKIGDKVTWVPDIGKNVVRGLKCKNKQIGLGDKLPKGSTINLILGDGKKD